MQLALSMFVMTPRYVSYKRFMYNTVAFIVVVVPVNVSNSTSKNKPVCLCTTNPFVCVQHCRLYRCRCPSQCQQQHFQKQTHRTRQMVGTFLFSDSAVHRHRLVSADWRVNSDSWMQLNAMKEKGVDCIFNYSCLPGFLARISV